MLGSAFEQGVIQEKHVPPRLNLSRVGAIFFASSPNLTNTPLGCLSMFSTQQVVVDAVKAADPESYLVDSQRLTDGCEYRRMSVKGIWTEDVLECPPPPPTQMHMNVASTMTMCKFPQGEAEWHLYAQFIFYISLTSSSSLQRYSALSALQTNAWSVHVLPQQVYCSPTAKAAGLGVGAVPFHGRCGVMACERVVDLDLWYTFTTFSPATAPSAFLCTFALIDSGLCLIQVLSSTSGLFSNLCQTWIPRRNA
jgi:hypothetical protein